MATAFVDDEANSPLPMDDGVREFISNTSKISWEEKLLQAKHYKQAGNEKYKTKEYKAAIGKYHRALLYLRGIKQSMEQMPLSPERELPKIPEKSLEEVYQLSAQCHNNLAACILQSENPSYGKVVLYCDEVLNDSPLDTKALYRKGAALYHLKCYEDSMSCLTKAANQSEGQKDANVRKYLQMCEKSLTAQHAEMKETYKAMFKS